MVINSDGTTSLCVGDWKHKLSYGDVKKQSVKDIWNGDILKNYHMSHLEGKRTDNDICKACQVISHGTIENIDEFAKDILHMMKK
jgi:radical SAM protein with 4Fe4S-binding SPASM domain